MNVIRTIFAALVLLSVVLSCNSAPYGYEERSAQKILDAADSARAETTLPGQVDTQAIESQWFPSRMHAFIWRNWTLVPADRLAEVLGTSGKNVKRIARSMGLEARPNVDSTWLSRKGYITVLRRNWQLLPYEQILTLLNISEEELEWRLMEDDFLFVKLGSIKPHCEPLTYSRPDRSCRRRCRQIAGIVKSVTKDLPAQTPRFDLFKDARTDISMPASDNLRMIFSYNAEYGDSLLDSEQSSYSEELLSSLRSMGINAVWIHSVLKTLVAPDGPFPGDERYRTRLDNLKTLVDRAARYGISVLLYVNEPRAMPASWFDTEERKSLAGSHEGPMTALCTSDKRTLDWVERSFNQIFSSVPGLGGVFMTTASENLTNCASRWHKEYCPRCAGRPTADIIAEVVNAITRGIKSANPDAVTIAADWGWDDDLAEEIISRLSKDCIIYSVSEWALPISRGGIGSAIGEYSISAVGPGPRALKNWGLAKKYGLGAIAKVMTNTSWELGSFPVIPAVELIADHSRKLAEINMKNVVMSWSNGGYPSSNLAIFERILDNPSLTLDSLAAEFYGKNAAQYVCKAWHSFSEGFKEYPFHMECIYNGPHHLGPANVFYPEKTGYKSTMVGIPYDDLDSWRQMYPTEIYVSQWKKVADGFREGIRSMEEACEAADPEKKGFLEVETNRYKAIYDHLMSVVNQVAFICARDNHDREGMLKAVDNELELCRDYLPRVYRDATIGYESSNHYFFVPQDIVEKVINLEYIKSIEQERATAKVNTSLRTFIHPGEKWWGGSDSFMGAYISKPQPMPYDEKTDIDYDFYRSGYGNQAAPFYVSTKGRYIWSDEPFKISFRKGEIIVDGMGEVILSENHGTLKEAFLDAARRHFPGFLALVS